MRPGRLLVLAVVAVVGLVVLGRLEDRRRAESYAGPMARAR